MPYEDEFGVKTVMTRLRYILPVVGLTILVLLIVRGCKEEPVVPDVTLRPNEKARVVINRDRISVITKDEPLHTEYMPDVSTIIFTEDGDVEIHTKTHGWTFQPGAGVGIGADDFRAVVDVKAAYWNRLGFNVGTNLRLSKQLKEVDPRIHFGLSVVLPYTRNTSFVLAVDHKKDVVGYLRVGF